MSSYCERAMRDWKSLAEENALRARKELNKSTSSLAPEVATGPYTIPSFQTLPSAAPPSPIVRLPGTMSSIDPSSVPPPNKKKRHCENEGSSDRFVRRKISEAPRCSGLPVKIIVGEGGDQQTFFVHEDLLKKHSRFFWTILRYEDSEETEQKNVSLSEHHPEVFQVFSNFLYTGQIFSSKDCDVSTLSSGDVPSDSEWTRLCLAWVLGDKLQSTAFMDACTDALIAKINETGTHPINAFSAIYSDGAGSDSGIHRLCVDLVIWKWNERPMSRCERDGRFGGFGYDVATALNKVKYCGLTNTAPFSTQGTCAYHDHGESSPCYKTIF